MAKRKPHLANMGEPFERCLTLQHEAYRRAGLADMDKIPTPIRQLGRARGGPETRGLPVFRATWKSRSTVDYGGVIKGGRAVRLEAKSTKIDRVPLDAVREHQAASLERTVSLGGFAAVLVLLPSGVWIVPWDFWAADGRKSLNPELLGRQGARVQDATGAQQIAYGMSTTVDWLGAARRRGWV